MFGIPPWHLASYAVFALAGIVAAWPKIKSMNLLSRFTKSDPTTHACTRTEAQAAIDLVLHYAEETGNAAMAEGARDCGRALYEVPIDVVATGIKITKAVQIIDGGGPK